MEDIRPAKASLPPKKPPSNQKSVQQLTQEFRDLLSEKVCNCEKPLGMHGCHHSCCH